MKLRYAKLLFLCSLVLVALLALKQAPKAANNNGELTVTFLDVGNGDCVLLQSEGQTMLVDAGKAEYGTNVVSFLKEQGINYLNYVLITHDDADHIGGISSVIKEFTIGKFLHTNVRNNDEANCKTANDLINASDVPIGVPVAGTSMKLGCAMIDFLAPNGGSYTSYNDYSIVIRVVNGQNSFLLAGDAETTSEKEMIAKGYNLKSDVLKVGHHSALTSSCQEFVDAVDPSISVISCNSAGASKFPRLGTIAKLTKGNIYRTDISGNITFVSDGTTITTEAEPYFYANSGFDKANGTITRTLEEECCLLQNVEVSSDYEEIMLQKICEDDDYGLLITKPLTLEFTAQYGISKMDSIEYALVSAGEAPDIDDMEWQETSNGVVTISDDMIGNVYVKYENAFGNIVIRKTTGFTLDCTAPTNCSVTSNITGMELLETSATNTYNRFTKDDTYPTFTFACDYGMSGEGNIEYMLVNRGDGFKASGSWTTGTKVTITNDFIGRIYVRFTDGAGNQSVYKTMGFKWINGKPTNLAVASNIDGVQLITKSGKAKTLTSKKAVKLTFSADFGHGGKQAIKYQIVKKGTAYKANGTWISKSSVTLPKGFAGTVYVRFIDKAGNTVLRKTNYIRISD